MFILVDLIIFLSGGGSFKGVDLEIFIMWIDFLGEEGGWVMCY